MGEGLLSPPTANQGTAGSLRVTDSLWATELIWGTWGAWPKLPSAAEVVWVQGNGG